MATQPSKHLSTFTIVSIIFAYAIIRYNILKGVPWEELPLFISNKAISLSAIVFISLSYALGSLARLWPKPFIPWLTLRKYFGLLGFGLAAFHGITSLLLFTPAYYPKFFYELGKLTFIGELSMLFGVLAFFVFAIVAFVSIPALSKDMDQSYWLKIQHMGYFGCFLILLHVTIMGFEGWMSVESWPGGLLPISFVAAIVILTVFLLKISAILFTRHE